MPTATYAERRGELLTYFDRTAVQAWERLTSDAPVSGIRATVRAGRDEMRELLLAWLPHDLSGLRVLDAGCGTGALALALAARGAEVIAVDISPRLIALARERAGQMPGLEFRVADLLDPGLGHFDHVVAMDSLIHYRTGDVARVLGGLAARTRSSMLFTFAPRTPLLAAMHAAGRMFPRGDRAPAIEPAAEYKLRSALAAHPELATRCIGQTRRVTRGFYISQAMEIGAA
jgi:magnesium-protoporphyrin O-methyltransferase